MGAGKMLARTFARRAAPALARRGFAAEDTSAKLKFSLVLPDAAPYDNAEVDLVVAPASNGSFGIMKDHVPTIAQLDAGIVTVHSSDGEDKFFVPGGFAIVKEDGAQVCTTLAVRVEDLDESVVNAGLKDAQAALAAASTDEARAEAMITVATYTSMSSAINAK